MRKRNARSWLLCGVGLVAVGLAAFQQPSASSIDELNDVVQNRLHNTKGAGMARITTVKEHFRGFDPAGPEARVAVGRLERRGFTVALYLGGLNLLNPPMSKQEWEKLSPHDRNAISNPLPITGREIPAGMPAGWELWETGQKALTAFAKADRYESSIGRWSIDARPVRVDRQECITCHAGRGGDREVLKIGDAVGVAMYVYDRGPKGTSH